MGNEPSSNSSSPTKKNKEKKQQWNPITQILSNKSIDSLKNKWNREELLIFEERMKTKRKDGWKLEEFIALFPKLKRKGEYRSGFSQETLQKIYNLFHRSNITENLTNSELLEGITMIKMSDSTELISRLIFYLYCDNNKKQMNNFSYLKFLKENKSRLRNIELLGELESWWPPKKTIGPEQFQQIVAEFDKDKFKSLFQPDFVLEQAKLVEALKVMKYLAREVGSEVYLIEFEWYLQWKDYMKMKYGLDPKIKEQKVMIDREKELSKSRTLFKSQKKLEYQYEIEKQVKRPGVIPNYKLVGDELEELKPGMREFKDYVMVPAWLWSSLYVIYQGHPQIKRLYPQVYCLKVYQVFVDEEARFVDNLTTHLQLCYNQMKIKEILDTENLKNTICMHKYPGLENWEETYNFDDSISKWNVYNCKIFICFVPKRLRDKFLLRYNVSINENGQKVVQERIKNYATLLHANIHGVVRLGFVIKISADSVYLEYRNQQNSRFEKKFKVSVLTSMNSHAYFQNQSRNLLAGLTNDNQGKSFLHALIQCFIRTPFFGKYLQSVPELIKNQHNKQNMIIWALSQIYSESQTRKGVINVTKFTNIIQRKIPMNSKFFLRRMLYILEKEFKLKHDQIEKDSMDNNSEGDRNVIIQQFFQTEGVQVTECDKCCYRQETTQDIYTHTLVLPEFEEIQIFFYYFPNNKSNNKWLPIKYGVTVKYDLKKDTFMKKAAALLAKEKEKLVFYAESDGEWKFNLREDETHERITEYHELGMRILCYQVQSIKNIHFQLRNRRCKIGSRYFHSFSVPLLLEVAPEDQWIDILKEIAVIYDGKFGDLNVKALNQRNLQRSLRVRKSLRSISERALQRVERGEDSDEDDDMYQNSMYNSRTEALDESHVMKSSIRKSQMSIDQMGKEALYTNQWYTIRVIKQQHPQHCFRCGRRFVKNTGLSQFCKGHCFKDTFKPSQDSRMMKHLKKVIITVDWLKYHCFDGFDHENDQSAVDLAKLSEQKKLQISQMLIKNPNFQEPIDCPNCEHEAIRRVTIKNYPNILILKRFLKTPQGLIKKQHRVFYDETLYHDGQKYMLFGVLIHVGTPTKGKYYSILKCDSYEQWFKCDEERVVDITKNQDLMQAKKVHISEDAYILFYRKANVDPAIMFYNPLI